MSCALRASWILASSDENPSGISRNPVKAGFEVESSTARTSGLSRLGCGAEDAGLSGSAGKLPQAASRTAASAAAAARVFIRT